LLWFRHHSGCQIRHSEWVTRKSVNKRLIGHKSGFSHSPADKYFFLKTLQLNYSKQEPYGPAKPFFMAYLSPISSVANWMG
jgi:hypothetical protein